MKFIGKFFLILLLILLLVLITGYFLLKSAWGAATLSRWISDETAYHLSIGRLHHSFSTPLEVTLDNFSFGHDGQPALVVADKVTLDLSLLQFSSPSRFDSITLTNGEVNLANISPGTAIPLQANHLRLNNISIVEPGTGTDSGFQASQIVADISPWNPGENSLQGSQYHFSMGIGQLTLNTQQLSNIHANGQVDPQQLTLDHLDGQAERGNFSGSLTRDAQGHWQVQQLSLQDIRFQTEKNLPDFLAPLVRHNIRPARIDISHATIVGPDWAVTDFNMQLANPQLPAGDLLTQGGTLKLQASELVCDNNDFVSPQADAEATPEGLRIDSISTHWKNGTLSASGDWLRANRQLALNNLTISGLEYTLPQDWRQWWMAPLPDWLDSVVVHQLAVSNSLVIDINPAFPFQMTALHGTGHELLLVRNHQWGIWSGDSEWKATEATFNRRDINAPWLKLHADDRQITVSDLKMLADNGPLVGSAQISQQPSRNFSLSLQGQSVPTDLFAHWGWPVTPAGEKGSITLNVTGKLQADQPLRPTVNGTLHLSTPAGAQQQSMQDGVIR
ncbi:AsmA-like C-terminal region-containing protein [Tatumella sp. UCD-D_suzukii]|uniref:AsmA family protein n=1 Tax=Tatumella sp. UCD-D_suzukii TaxID=1408192 RepID=UPI0004700FCA|nr:AsmA family protein [Tatumella sp. UCD-D_suzukii]